MTKDGSMCAGLAEKWPSQTLTLCEEPPFYIIETTPTQLEEPFFLHSRIFSIGWTLHIRTRWALPLWVSRAPHFSHHEDDKNIGLDEKWSPQNAYITSRTSILYCRHHANPPRGIFLCGTGRRHTEGGVGFYMKNLQKLHFELKYNLQRNGVPHRGNRGPGT